MCWITVSAGTMMSVTLAFRNKMFCQLNFVNCLSHTNMYSDKLKNEFEPVLKFFDVIPTGNIFNDITKLAEALSSTKNNMNDKITRYFFDYYDMDGNGKIDRDEFKRLVKDIGQALVRFV